MKKTIKVILFFFIFTLINSIFAVARANSFVVPEIITIENFQGDNKDIDVLYIIGDFVVQ